MGEIDLGGVVIFLEALQLLDASVDARPDAPFVHSGLCLDAAADFSDAAADVAGGGLLAGRPALGGAAAFDAAQLDDRALEPDAAAARRHNTDRIRPLGPGHARALTLLNAALARFCRRHRDHKGQTQRSKQETHIQRFHVPSPFRRVNGRCERDFTPPTNATKSTITVFLNRRDQEYLAYRPKSVRRNAQQHPTRNKSDYKSTP